jgi:hypothetical protein
MSAQHRALIVILVVAFSALVLAATAVAAPARSHSGARTCKPGHGNCGHRLVAGRPRQGLVAGRPRQG